MDDKTLQKEVKKEIKRQKKKKYLGCLVFIVIVIIIVAILSGTGRSEKNEPDTIPEYTDPAPSSSPQNDTKPAEIQTEPETAESFLQFQHQ